MLTVSVLKQPLLLVTCTQYCPEVETDKLEDVDPSLHKYVPETPGFNTYPLGTVVSGPRLGSGLGVTLNSI